MPANNAPTVIFAVARENNERLGDGQMPHTFDEVFAHPVPAGHVAFCNTIFVITQEDGRTAWGGQLLNVDSKNRSLSVAPTYVADPNYHLAMRFSDRNQFQGQADNTGVTITEAPLVLPPLGQPGSIGPRGIVARFILHSWGHTQYSVSLNLESNVAQSGKLYTGWGQTIGHGSGLALHTIAFVSVTTGQPISPPLG